MRRTKKKTAKKLSMEVGGFNMMIDWWNDSVGRFLVIDWLSGHIGDCCIIKSQNRSHQDQLSHQHFDSRVTDSQRHELDR